MCDAGAPEARPYARRYARWAAWCGARPTLARALGAANRAIVWVFYASFAVLLALEAARDPVRLVPLVGILGVAFALVSLVRARIDAPRPYERDGVSPLIARDGAGRSLPSRHAFSAFAIAAGWWCASPAVSVGLGAAAVVLAALRVAGGVHYPRDVVAGAALGLAAGAIAAACALAL